MGQGHSLSEWGNTPVKKGGSFTCHPLLKMPVQCVFCQMNPFETKFTVPIQPQHRRSMTDFYLHSIIVMLILFILYLALQVF
jgi:hypothetical protein